MLASVLAGTTPLAAFARSGEFMGLENRELLLLDTHRGERARVRRSLFGGGGVGTVESDSQSAIPRSKSGLDSTHPGITSRLELTISSFPSVSIYACTFSAVFRAVFLFAPYTTINQLNYRVLSCITEKIVLGCGLES